MQISYKKNILQIYFWQGLSVILGFASMFVVLPFLSREPIIYGTYSVCISVSIFLSYADLGFIGAGQKYAAEAYAQGNRKEESSIIAFVSFILFIMIMLCSVIFLIFSIFPELIIKNFTSNENRIVGSSLFLIIALFSPSIVLQRACQMIFGIRIEDYLYQRITIIGNVIRILSVFYFFTKNNYDIVGYFMFIQIIGVLCGIFSIYLAKKRYNYDFHMFFRSFKFQWKIFNKTKKLAFSSLFLTLTWILYYELDTIVIGKLLGVEKVAIFAIGLTILSFFRSIFGIIFTPFFTRFNHFIGLKDDMGLKLLYKKVILLTFPVVVLPIIEIELLAKPLVLSWVGDQYAESIHIVRWLVACNIFAYISYPANFLLIAKEKIKLIYISSAILPLIYWLGSFLTYKIFGLQALSMFKFISFFINAIIYLNISKKFLNINLFNALKSILKPYATPLIIVIFLLIFIEKFLPLEKGFKNLLLVLLTGGLSAVIFWISCYFTSSSSKAIIKDLKNSFT